MVPSSDSTSSMPITVVLFHAGSCSVDDTTYFGIEFIFSANPCSFVRDGHAAAKPSYVFRPRSCASAESSSSSLKLLPASPRSNLNAQPPNGAPSAPPGSSMTPSSVTNSVTTIRLLMLVGPSQRRQLIAHEAEPLDRGEHLVMRHRAEARLHEEAIVTEQLVLEADLLDHFLNAADNECAAACAQRVEVLPRRRRPAALAPDRRHHVRVRLVELVRVADVAVRVDAQAHPSRPAKQLRERHEPLGHAADDRERHPEAERTGAHCGLGIPADADPEWDRLLDGQRKHAVRSRIAAKLDEPRKLLGEETVIVGEVVAEERKRLDEGAAAEHDLGAAARDQVDLRELLEDADGIVRAQDGDGARQANARRACGDCRERDRRRADRVVRPMVLADA